MIFSAPWKDSAPAIDAGAPLTQIATADPGSGATIHLDDANWFFRECSNYPTWMGVRCEQICIGADATDISTAHCGIQITAIDWTADTIVVSNPPPRNDGDFVWLYADSRGDVVIHGKAPDLGAFEYSGLTQQPPRQQAPVNFHILP
jgi:hypothetical protein